MKSFFEELNSIIDEVKVPVILGGDFNAIVNSDERLGDVENLTSMDSFSDFIQRNNLVNLPLSGASFNWFRGKNCIAANRLDIFLVSPEVLLWFPNIVQSALPRSLSDHSPIVLKDGIILGGPDPFKLFTHWLDNPDCFEVVKGTLIRTTSKEVGHTLRATKGAIKEWVRNLWGKENDSTEFLEKRISMLEDKMCYNEGRRKGCGIDAKTEMGCGFYPIALKPDFLAQKKQVTLRSKGILEHHVFG
ncbi:hypothetical protein V6N13_071302 [Hibiscus sabdariffa]